MDDNNLHPDTEAENSDDKLLSEEKTEDSENLPEKAETESESLNNSNETETVQSAETQDVKSDFQQFLDKAKQESAYNGETPNDISTDAYAIENADENIKPKKKIGGKIALILMIVVLILSTGALIYVIVSKSGSSSKIDFDEVVLTVDNVDSSAGEYVYWYKYVDAYYSNYYSYYYSSITEDQKKENTLNQMKYINALYSKAVAGGYELDDDDKAEIDKAISSYENASESETMEVDDYLSGYFGKGFTIDMLRSYLEKQSLAYKYYDSEMKKITDEYSGESGDSKVEEAYDADRQSFDVSDISYWYFDSTDTSAKTKADSVVKAVKAGGTFDAAIRSVTGGDSDTAKSLKGYTKDTISTNFSENAANWIFAVDNSGKYTSVAGTVTTIDESGVIYVLYVNNEPYKDMSIPVTVDYIKVDISTDDSVKTADELKLEAKAKANDIYSEFTAGTVSDDAFKAIIDKYEKGNDDLISGDIFDSIKNDGSRDSAVDAWIFDDGRKVNDCAIVETNDGFYVLFFVGKDENPVWYSSALSSVLKTTQTEWESKFNESYADSVVTNDEAINSAVEYINSITVQS